jgi:hypothetical protein
LLLFPIASFPIYQDRHLSGAAREEVFFSKPLATRVDDYFEVVLTAQNVEGAPIQYSSASIKWDLSQGYDALQTEDFTFFIDNATHRYRVPVGQNRRWTAAPVHSFFVETREIEGISMSLREVSLKRRMPAAIDARLNRWAVGFFGLRSISPYFFPATILLAASLLAGFAYIKIFKPAGIHFRGIVFVLSFALLLSFGLFFFRSQLITIKSHFISQKETIKSQGLQYTYAGFLDFRKFLGWIGENTGKEEGLLFLVRGQPVYIMSEAVYSLYPRKIRFVDLSQSHSEVLADIHSQKDFQVIIALTAQDFMRIRNIKGLTLEDRYRQDAGFILRIER